MNRLVLVFALGLFATSSCKEEKKGEADKTAPADKTKDPGSGDVAGEKPPADTKKEPAKPAGLEVVALARPASAAEKTAADDLVKKLSDDAQRNAAISDKANGRSHIIVAATSTDPKVVAAALKGMKKSHDAKTAQSDADFVAVTAARLGARDHTVLAPAFMAARHVIGGADVDPVKVAIVKLINDASDPPAQHAAIGSLRGWRDNNKDKTVIAALVKATESKAAYVSSQGLSKLAHAGTEGLADKDGFRAKVEAMLKHDNPAVRGEACAMLTKFVPFGAAGAAEAEKIGKTLLPLLKDENPFVKSRAASSLASVKYKPGLHHIVALLDDPTPNTFDNKDWKTPWGTTGWDHHDGSGWSRVDDAALFAMSSMTFFDKGKGKFSYNISSKTKEADLKKAVASAKKWYAANKSKIPE